MALLALSAISAALPPAVASAVWRGDELGCVDEACVATGFAALDAELPGGGWPTSTVVEVLQPQFSLVEWRLLLPALAPRAGKKAPLLVIGPPHAPYFGGLRQYGLDERHAIVVNARTPAERLWATEQAVKADGLAGVIAWLSHARGDQIRRLQACSSQSGFPVFLIRPEAAQHESSPAPLRLQVRGDGVESLKVHVLKRRGPSHDDWLTLRAAPPGFERLLPANTAPRHLDAVLPLSPIIDSMPAAGLLARVVPLHVAALDGIAASPVR